MTPEQIAERKSGIGGSDLACVLGLSPWRSPVDVWLEKTGQNAVAVEETPAMYWGSQLEELVAREYARRTGRVVSRVNKTLRHPELPLVGHIDRAVGEIGERPVLFGKIVSERLLECKTASGFGKGDWGAEGTDEIPMYYACQVQHYMGLTGCEVCDLAVLFDGRDFQVFTVALDRELVNNMWGIAAEWWARHVTADTPPPPRTAEDCQKLFTKSAARRVVAPASIENAARRLAEVSAVRKTYEDTEKELRDQIAACMGDAEELITPATDTPLVTWKSAKPTTKTDWEGLAKSLNPTTEKVAEFTKEVPGSRRFLVKVKVESPAQKQKGQ